MGELGIDIAQAKPRRLTDELAERADVIVTMGCGDSCPYFPGKRYLEWDLPDPKGQPIAVVRDGDIIRIDVPERRLDLEVPAEEIQSRLRAWRPPQPRYRTGALAKYAALVSSSALGAVCL